MKAGVFLDFDDVLFDTRAFVADLRESFLAAGISKEDFEKHYLDYPVRTDNGVRTYDVSEHLDRIESAGVDVTAARSAVDRLMADTQKYLFSDVIEFLRRMNDRPLFLVSYGNGSFQRRKMKVLKERGFFRDAIVSEKSKADVLEEIARKYGSETVFGGFFVDDRLDNVQEVKRRFSGVRTFLMQRPEGRYRDRPDETCDYVVHELDETRNIIESFL